MSDLGQKILVWYDANKRDLPWRKTKDPYKIWLSEIMLQQTTVKTVIPYYQNFLKKFPNLQSVATADDSDLIHAWSGLGYYQRIRNFKKACSQVMSDYQGKVPSSFEILITLSGLGPYTAAAVASIAFDEKVAVVDGNVIRVLSRLFTYSEDIASSRSKKFFAEKATEFLSSKRPGDFNQAMMELGATVCTPKKPLCLLCPVRSFCLAYKNGNPESYPVKNKKTVYKKEFHFVFILKQNGHFMMRQRTGNEIMSGLWEFPMEAIDPHFKSDTATLLKIIKDKKWPMGEVSFLKSYTHAIMNRRMALYPVVIDVSNSPQPSLKLRGGENVWKKREELSKVPITTITRKALKFEEKQV